MKGQKRRVSPASFPRRNVVEDEDTCGMSDDDLTLLLFWSIFEAVEILERVCVSMISNLLLIHWLPLRAFDNPSHFVFQITLVSIALL